MRYHHARRRANVTASQKVVSAMKIRLKVGATPLTATLLESKASRDFASLLPLTLTMNDLFRREKYEAGAPTRTRSDRSRTGPPGRTWRSITARTVSRYPTPGSSSSERSIAASKLSMSLVPRG